MHCYPVATPRPEPWLSEQWFVAVDKLKGRRLTPSRSGKGHASPRAGRRPTTWMENLKDWCISPPAVVGPPHSRVLLRGLRLGGRHTGDTDVCAPSAAVITCIRTRHCWTPGSARSCGLSPRRALAAKAGAARGPSSRRHSSPRATSSRCGVARMVMSSLYFLDEVPFKGRRHLPDDSCQGRRPHGPSQGNGGVVPWTSSVCTALMPCATTCSRCAQQQDVKFDANIDKRRPRSSSTARAPSRPRAL